MDGQLYQIIEAIKSFMLRYPAKPAHIILYWNGRRWYAIKEVCENNKEIT